MIDRVVVLRLYFYKEYSILSEERAGSRYMIHMKSYAIIACKSASDESLISTIIELEPHTSSSTVRIIIESFDYHLSFSLQHHVIMQGLLTARWPGRPDTRSHLPAFRISPKQSRNE